MLLDSLCAYLVFSCFIIILVLLSPSPVCVFVFVCFLFVFAKFYLCALSVLLQFFFLNICLCFAVHLTFPSVSSSLFINSITNFRFRSSTICVFPPQLASTVLSFFSLPSLWFAHHFSTEPNESKNKKLRKAQSHSIYAQLLAGKFTAENPLFQCREGFWENGRLENK